MSTVHIVLIAFILFFSFIGIGQVISEDWILAMDFAGIILGLLFTCLTLATGFVAWREKVRIKNWFKKVEFVKTGDKFDENAAAIVIPVSRRIQPEWIIRQLRPKYVAFLYTEASMPEAMALATSFGEQIHFVTSVEDMKKAKHVITNPDAPEQAKELTKKFIQKLLAEGIPKQKIFVDTTGGKVPMSIGAFQGAEEMGVSSIYIVGTQDNGFINDPQDRTHGKPIFISDKTMN